MDIDSILYFVVALIIFIVSLVGNKKKKPSPQQMAPNQKTGAPTIFDELFDMKEEQEPQHGENEILDQANGYSFSGYKSIEDISLEDEKISGDDKNGIPKYQKEHIDNKLLPGRNIQQQKKSKLNLKQAIIHQVILERRDEQF